MYQLEVKVKMKQFDKEKKMPALNGRFGVMAAVAPQTRQCKFGSLYPAGSLVEAATTPSRWDVICKRGTVQWDNET